MRHLALLAVLAAAVSCCGCPSTPSISDFDGDGYPDQQDCVPDDPTIHPGALETCDDGIDNDCDGFIDAADADCGGDADGDGWTSHNDCDDDDPDTYPGAVETCDGHDNDCDGTIDEGTSCYDDDGDGYTEDGGDCDDTDPSLNLDDVDLDQYSTCDGDCDDGQPLVNPGHAETCDGVDNDCDGVIDDACATCEIRVPDDYSTISDAIGVTNGPTVICVDAGAYVDHVDFDGREIRLIGVTGPTHTVIDGGWSGAVVSMTDVSPLASLEGFTITHGLGVGGQGGGVDLFQSSPTLDKLVVTDNWADEAGAGITCEGDSTAVLQTLEVSWNDSDELGGGILIKSSNTAVTVRDAELFENTATMSGGGLVVFMADALIEDVSLHDNLALVSGGGATIAGNVTADEGAGVLLAFGSDLTADHLVVDDNSAVSGGGGIHVDTSALTLVYSDAWANSPVNYDGITDPTGTAGNVAVDPQLLDLTGADPLAWDVHLGAASPLIDAGDPGAADVDGGPADMGCYGGTGASGFDLDLDGYPAWWQPGPYDHGAYPAQDLDCDDRDPGVTPDGRC